MILGHNELKVKACEVFEKARNILIEYGSKQNELDVLLKNEISYTEHCVGSNKDIGYYISNPVIDIVIGGIKRGRLIKNSNTKLRITHDYMFDSKNNLRYVKGYLTGDVYFLITDNEVWGLRYNSYVEKIDYILYEEYTDNKLSFRMSFCCVEDCNIIYDAFIFIYNENRLAETVMFNGELGCVKHDIIVIPNNPNKVKHKLFETVKFVFSADEKGFITSYDVFELNNNKCVYINTYSNLREKRNINICELKKHWSHFFNK